MSGLYDTFRFTTTGSCLCHPVTVALLAGAVAELEGISFVGHDMRLNAEGVRFTPDVVGLRDPQTPLICVDFESPNSSDARIVKKDVRA